MRTSLDLHIDPRRSRLTYVGLMAGALLIIWSACFASLYFVRQNDRLNLEARIKTDVLILEEHASRTLDTVAARLDTLASLSDPQALNDGRLASSALRDLILDDRIVRSMSLVGPDGRVLSSSTPANEGMNLPAALLQGDADLPAMGDMRFKAVALRRDLHDLVQDTASSPAGAAPPAPSSAASPATNANAPTGWLAIRDLNLGGRTYQLVAVVNLTLFESLWARVDNEDATELVLMDLAGRRLVSHHAVPKDEQALRAALREAVGPSPAGRFDLGAGERFQVHYRVSPRHPVAMVVIGDRQALAAAHASTLRNFALAALLTSIAVVALLTRLYRIYQRYESTAVEMSNQARAIGAHMLVSESSPEGTILSVNDNYCLTSGYEAAELVGQNHRIFNSGIHPQGYYRVLWETVLAGKVWKGTFRNRHKDGSHIWLMATIIPFVNPWGKVERFVAIYTDITESITLTREVSQERHRREQLAQVNQDLLSAVHTDPLTGVANRRGFDSFASHLPAVGGQGPLAVLMLDLDHFKSVNDNHGHAAGDEVLKVMARRWAQQIRDSDLLARMGGEEFCILLPGADLEGARGVAEKIRLATCSTPVMVPDGQGRRPLPVTVSIGLAWAGPSSTASLQTLLDLADEAVYESKDSGRNRVSARVG